MNRSIQNIILLLLLTFSPALFSQKEVDYKDGDISLKGYFSECKSKLKNAPGIVIIHQWMGLTQHEKTVADKLSALGYNAFAADIYGVGHVPKNREEAGKIAGSYKSDYKTFQKRIKAAIDQLVELGADSNNIVVIGYCFGGTGAIESARAGLPVKGIVSFHGGLGKDTLRASNTINTKVLVLHGADDPFISKNEIELFQKEMRTSNADWQMIYYANSVHAFTQTEAGNDNSKGAAYNKKADERSWEHLKLFLKETFN
jgi:dienelactone hydrolase